MITNAAERLKQFPTLQDLFRKVNAKHFEGSLPMPSLFWNTRLRASAGRFTPARFNASIDVATYLLEERDALALVEDTLAHEMIHYWLWLKHKPYGHTKEFLRKMHAMGVSRYNTVPRVRPDKCIYRCPACLKEIRTKKRLNGNRACLDCCNRYNRGKYSERFKLYLERRVDS